MHHLLSATVFWQHAVPISRKSCTAAIRYTFLRATPWQCVNAGPHHAISLPPDLQGIPTGGPAPASRLGQGSQQRTAASQLPLVATQSVPAGTSRLSALSQAPYLDSNRLTSTNIGFQEQQHQQQAAYYERAVGPTALRRFSHVSHATQRCKHGTMKSVKSQLCWCVTRHSYLSGGGEGAS